MAKDEDWIDLGAAAELATTPLQRVTAKDREFAVSYKDGTFGAIANACNHVGGPLGEGRLDGDYIVCPWHNWKFHRASGLGEPGFEEDRIPSYRSRSRAVASWSTSRPRPSATSSPTIPIRSHARSSARPDPCALRASRPRRWTPPIRASRARIISSSTPSTSAREHGAETRHIKLNDLKFRACEGYYSKSAQACTWPCSITQMDDADQMDRVYEAIVHWADTVIVATPIRWGAASSSTTRWPSASIACRTRSRSIIAF